MILAMIDKMDIVNYYKNIATDEESMRYLAIHAKRYALLLKIIQHIRNTMHAEKINVIDIGPSFLTEQVQSLLKNDAVYYLGYSHPESRGGHFPEKIILDTDKFIRFDLNDVQYKEKWISVPSGSIVILAEVIEHLFTAPQLILNFIRTFLEKNGVLIVQTPNAVSLFKRIKIAFGENPFEMIRENSQNPGHFREYTKKELLSMAGGCNFKIIDFFYSNYFELHPFNYKAALYRIAQYTLGKSFYDGMTIVLQKNE